MPLSPEATDSLIADLIASKDVEEAKAKLSDAGYTFAPSASADEPAPAEGDEGAESPESEPTAEPKSDGATAIMLGLKDVRKSMADDYGTKMKSME